MQAVRYNHDLRILRWVEAATLVVPPPAPTVTLIGKVMRPALRAPGLPGVVVQGVDRSDLGIGFFFDGLIVGLPTPVLRARTSLGRFAQGQAAGKQFFQGRVSFTFIAGGHRRGLHSSPCVTA